MAKTTCIQHPANQLFIVIHRWQLDFCDGNRCAAALLSLFERWHNIRLCERSRNPHKSLWHDHTSAQLEKDILIFKRDTITDSIDTLRSRGAIEVHVENGDRSSGKAKLWKVLFQPKTINKWLKDNEWRYRDEESDSGDGDSEKSLTDSEKSLTVKEKSPLPIIEEHNNPKTDREAETFPLEEENLDLERDIFEWCRSTWGKNPRTRGVKFKAKYPEQWKRLEEAVGRVEFRRAWLQNLEAEDPVGPVDWIKGIQAESGAPSMPAKRSVARKPRKTFQEEMDALPKDVGWDPE